MVKRKTFGIKIIGKPFQYDGDQYAVIKTKMGFYARCKGKNWHKIGNRHSTAHKARNELMNIVKVAKQAKLEKKKGMKKHPS